MNRIGETRTHAHEFTIYKVNKPDPGYEVELDGEFFVFDTSLAWAHKAIKAGAKAKGLAGAGVTEVFGRNKQAIITPRYGYKTYKGD